ncbi:MAG: choice-of-anchor tandem repeat GloVer-containing protein [Candidatus Cybelea sp.]
MRGLLAILACAVLLACAHTGGSGTLPAQLTSPFASRPDAAGFQSLYSFKGLPDASSPAAGMVALNGTLYGTAQTGGRGEGGAVFATSTSGKERVLYSFGSGGVDGLLPVAGLVVLSGKLYGATTSGGTHGFGALFSVDKSGNEHLLYSFAGGSDGAQPYAALVADGGVLYGTTYVGGGSANCTQGCGTVFSVTTAGKEHVIYRFKGGSDRIGPFANLIVVNSSLYRTTADGGKNGTGTIFKTTKSGGEQVIHSFGSGFDGSEPEAGLINVGDKLYGTTNGGGKHFNGTAFVTTTGGGERVIYDFKGAKMVPIPKQI